MSSISKKTLNDRHYDDMMLALLPLIVCATIIYSSRVLLVCSTAFVTARIVDVAMAVVRKQEIDGDDKTSTVAALTFAMMLPVSVPLYIVVMTVAVTILVGKHVFGGKDAYPFSLAALAMCMAAVNWPEEVFRAVKPFTPVSFWSGAAQTAVSGSTRIKNGGLPYISMLDLLLGNHAGAMGTSCVLFFPALLFSNKCCIFNQSNLHESRCIRALCEPGKRNLRFQLERDSGQHILWLCEFGNGRDAECKRAWKGGIRTLCISHKQYYRFYRSTACEDRIPVFLELYEHHIREFYQSCGR